MSRAKYISILANGTVAAMRNPTAAPEIVLSFYGPRGGSQGLVSISLEAARELRKQLDAIVQQFEQEGA